MTEHAFPWAPAAPWPSGGTSARVRLWRDSVEVQLRDGPAYGPTLDGWTMDVTTDTSTVSGPDGRAYALLISEWDDDRWAYGRLVPWETCTDKARADLIRWQDEYGRRNGLVRSALAAGLDKMEIHRLTGLSRSTIDRVEDLDA